MAPFAKGGGPKDRGIFASNRHFHKRAQKGNSDLYLEVAEVPNWIKLIREPLRALRLFAGDKSESLTRRNSRCKLFGLLTE